PDGKTLASMTSLEGNFTLRLWDVATGQQRHVVKEPFYVGALVFSPDGRLLASPVGKQVRLWNSTTGQGAGTVDTRAHALGFAPDGKTMATGDRKGVVTLWETATWKKQVTLQPLPSVAGSYIRDPCLTFSADGTLLAQGGMEAIVLWDVAGRKEKRRLP